MSPGQVKMSIFVTPAKRNLEYVLYFDDQRATYVTVEAMGSILTLD